MDSTIRNLDEGVYRRMKAHAALEGKTMGQVVNEAMEAYLARAGAPARATERVAHKASSHAEARRWDVEQNQSMSPGERMRAARALRDRVFPPDAKDVRAWHRSG
ncbi:MAG: hypothetical protein AMXMBFR53_25400 [Gemmatimonadota bacterium]